mgnify:CR=1 FL=1
MKKTGLGYEPCFTRNLISLRKRHPTEGFNYLRLDGLLNLWDVQLPGRILRMLKVSLWAERPLQKLPANGQHTGTSNPHPLTLENCIPASVYLGHSPSIYWKLKKNRSFGHKLHASPRHFHLFHRSRFDTTRYLAGCNRVVRVRPVHFLGLWVQSVRSYLIINGIIHLPQARNNSYPPKLPWKVLGFYKIGYCK